MRDQPGEPVPPQAPENPPPSQPAINLPPLTLWLAVALVAVHVLRDYLLSPAGDYALMLRFAFIASNWLSGPGLADLPTPITHMLLHASWAHLIFNTGFLIAFGAGLERALGARRLMLALGAGGVAGAAAQFLADPASPVPMVGISDGVSALFAMAMMALAIRSGGWRRLAAVTALWLALNLGFGLIGIPGDPTIVIAWQAHVGGYFAGMAYGFPLGPQGPPGRRRGAQPPPPA